jgi:hypothetical protein
VKLATLPWSGGLSWWTDDGSSAPENYEFPGYILTMQDGTEYRIDREPMGEKTFVSGAIGGNYARVYGRGRLVEIKSRSNDKIAIGTNRIDHVSPSGQLTRSIWLQRDEENRIVAINDPIAGSNGVSETQPIAGEMPTFLLAISESASWSSRPCNSGRCAFSCIHPNASIPQAREATSSAVLVNLEHHA